MIANRTASTPRLLHEIGERAGAGATFTLLIPPDHGDHSDWSPEGALELVGRAAGADVASMASREDPLDTVHRAVSDGEFDELIVCTAARISPLGASRPAPSPPAARAAGHGDLAGR